MRLRYFYKISARMAKTVLPVLGLQIQSKQAARHVPSTKQLMLTFFFQKKQQQQQQQQLHE